MVNIMNCMPKSMQPKVKSALHEIWQAPTKDEANKAFDLFEEMFEDKYPNFYTVKIYSTKGAWHVVSH